MDIDNIKNAKFDFSKDQRIQIINAAYFLAKAADSISNVNGMLGYQYNALAADLIKQVGLEEGLEADAKLDIESGLSDVQKKEISDIYNELEAKLNDN